MSSRKPKKGQKLGSSRRLRHHNREIEENENEDRFPDPGNQEHDSEQCQLHTVSESPASNEPSLLHSDQPVIACTNPSTSGFELSPDPESEDFKDLLTRAEVTTKKRKMGSTRKGNRNFKFEGNYEDEQEHRAQLSKGVSDEQEVTVQASIKEDEGKEDQTSLSDHAPSQSSEHESSILQGKHLALGTIVHDEDDRKNDEHQHFEAALQNKPMDISCSELNQLRDAEFSQDLLHTSLDLSIASPAECNVSPQEIDESIQMIQDDKVDTVTWGNVSNEASTEDENIIDHALKHTDDNLMITKESVPKSKSTEFREDSDEYKEVSVAGDRTHNDSDGGVAAINLNHAVESDRNIISPLKLKNQEVETSSDPFLSYEVKFQCDSESKGYREEYDLSETRCSTGESRADEDIGKKEADMHYDEEEKYRVIGTEREVENDGMQSTTNRLLFSKVSSTNMLVFATESELIPAETLCGETETRSQTCNLQHDNLGEFPTQLEMQSTEGVCSDQMLEKITIDTSEFLDTEPGVIEEKNNDIKEDINAGSTERFTQEDFIKVDDEKEQEMASVITNAFTNQASMVVKEHVIESPVHAYPTSDPVELILEAQVKVDMQVFNAVAVPDQKQNTSEECLVNPTNRESEAEQFESTSPNIYIQESRLGQNETKQTDSSQGNLSGLISAGDQKDSFKAMHDTNQVQSIKESTPISEDGFKFSFIPETCYPQSSELLNVTEPEAESIDGNMFKSVAKNEKADIPAEYNETSQHISTEVVNTNQECSVLDSQDEETVMVKNICSGVATTHLVLSDVCEHLVDNGVLKMQSRTEVTESIAQNEQAIWEGDKDDQHISIVPHQNTSLDVELGQSKLSDCSEFTTVTINTDELMTSAEPQPSAEVAQLPEANIPPATTTPIPEEAHMLTSTNSHRRKMGSTHRTLGGKGKEDDKEEDMYGKENDMDFTDTSILQGPENKLSKEKDTMEDSAKCSQHYMYSNSQTLSSSQTAIEHPSPATEHPDFKEDDGNSIRTVEKTNAENHTQTQAKKKKKFGSTRRPHGRHQPHAEGEEGEWKDLENTEEIEHQTVTSNLLTEPQNTLSELPVDIHDSPVITEQRLITASEDEIVTGGIDAPPAMLSKEDDLIHTVVSDEVSNAEELTDITEKNKKSGVNEVKEGESMILNEQEFTPTMTKVQDDAFIEHVSLAVEKHCDERSDNESEVNAPSTCGPVELIPVTQSMSEMQMDTGNIHEDASDQNANITEEHLEDPTNKEPEPEQLESAGPFVQIQESKSSQADVIKENLEISSSEKRRKIGSTRRSRRGQIPGHDQKNIFEEIKEKETLQEQNMDQEDTNTEVTGQQESIHTGVTEEEHNDAKDEINAGTTENFIEEDITTVCSQQSMFSETSSQATELGLTTIEHPSPAREHPDFKEDDGNSIRTVEKTNAENHTQTQAKKKKKFGSTRRPHGRHQPHAEGEEGEWKDLENTEEIEHQTVTSNLLTEPQNTLSELPVDIHDSPVITEQRLITASEDEIVTGGIDAPPAMLSNEDDLIHTVVSGEVSNAEELTDITEKNKKSGVNEVKEGESMILNEQEFTPTMTKVQDDAFIEHVSLAVEKHCDERSDNESEVNAPSTCGPVELIPVTQSMSEMQMDTGNIHEDASDQNTNITEEHLEDPTNKEPEPEQLESTGPFVQIQDSKSSQADVIKENLEISSSEKRRKIGSTRRSRRGQIPGHDQKNIFEEIKEKETLQEQNMDQEDINTEVTGQQESIHTGVTEEEHNDAKDEINAGTTENFTEEDITTVCSQQSMFSETSSQATELGLTTIEHPSPAREHPDFKEDDGNSIRTVEKTNAENHTQTQAKKKKKFGSTRRPHGRHQPHAEGEEGEWKDLENTEEIEHQTVTSNLLTEPQNTLSELPVDIHDSPVITEQRLITASEDEIVTGGIDAPPAILSKEDDLIHTVVSDEVSNAEELTDITEKNKKSGVNEVKEGESMILNEQEFTPTMTKVQDDAFIEHVSLAVEKHCDERSNNESEVNAPSTCGPVELIPVTQSMSEMQMDTGNIHEDASDQNANITEEHLEDPTNKELEPEQLESTGPFVQIQDSKSSQADVIKENLESSSSEKRRKIGSTRRSRRGQITGSDQKNIFEEIKEKETLQEQNMDQEDTNTEVTGQQESIHTGVTEEEHNDAKDEINAGITENFTEEDITTVCSQQSMFSETSSQATELGLTTIEHPSPATEHPDFKEDDGNSIRTVEKTNAENHTQTQAKKKKKFGSTRRPHGRHQPHAEGEEGEWKDLENTEEIEHQTATSNLLTEPQNTLSELPVDIHDSPVITEQNLNIASEDEIVTGGIDAPPAILSKEDDQIHTVVSGEVSNAEELTDITEKNKSLNEKKDAGSTHLNKQELTPIMTNIQDDAFIEHVSVAVEKHCDERPDNESASEVNAPSTCGPVELIPEIQSMSEMQMDTGNIHTVASDHDQSIIEEYLEETTNKESEPEQLKSTGPFVQIKENLEFNSSKKRRKIGSTRRSLRGQIPGTNQKNTFEEIKEKETIQEHNMDQEGPNTEVTGEQEGSYTGVTEEEHKDTKEEIIAGQPENFTEEDITTVCSQQAMLSELSSQTTDLGLTTVEHPSPATEHPDFKEDDRNPIETVENRNAENHTQTQAKKKKKFGSTRKPHGRHQPHAEGEEGEWKNVDDTKEIQIIDQTASSDLLTEIKDTISELSPDTLKPSLRTDQGVECTENENTNQLAYSSHGPIEFLPETQTRFDMSVVFEHYHTVSDEHLENPRNREPEPEPVVHIQELTLALDDMATPNSVESNPGRRKKLGSTRRSRRETKEKENIQEQTTEENTSTSEKDHILNLTHQIAHQAIQTHSGPVNVIKPETDKLDSICKSLEEDQSQDMNPRYAGNVDKEYLKLVVIEDMHNPDSMFCDTDARLEEQEPQIHNKLEQSENSLLSEIEFYLNKSFESTLNSTALNPNISEFSETMSEGSLQLPSSQNPELHTEPSSPARRRKMGSSRKMSRNKHVENVSNESRGSEQKKENCDKNNPKNSDPKSEAMTVKETVMVKCTEDMKESVELMSEVQALSQINESGTQATGQPLPEGRRKFGSRRTAKGTSGLGAFTHGDYESTQEKTDVLRMTKDDLRVSDPYFSSEPGSTQISQPVSEPRPETETVGKDPNLSQSTEPGLVSLDNIRKTSQGVVSTGGRQKIDFEQWNVQLPDFGLAVYNVVMVGDSNVGKTSFIKRLQTGNFTPDYSATIGVDTFVQTVTFGSRTVKLYVWDTAGQERYHSITRQVFHKAQGLLLMYDITSCQSFHAVRDWISQVQENAPPDVILMLLGNKNDCAHREVQLQEGEDLSKEYNIHFMECSAATGENVSESLKTLAWLLVKQRVKKEEENTPLQPKPQNKKSGCC